jgi:hypothetical protein
MAKMLANGVTKLSRKGANRRALAGAVRGVLCGINAQGEPLIDFCGNSTGEALVALTTVPVRPEDVGKEAVLLFEDGDPTRPLLMGLVQTPGHPAHAEKNVHVVVDGQRLTLAAQEEIVLRCGEASITLTRAGKVLIKGAYLSSRSTGPNRIRGASIHLN